MPFFPPPCQLTKIDAPPLRPEDKNRRPVSFPLFFLPPPFASGAFGPRSSFHYPPAILLWYAGPFSFSSHPMYYGRAFPLPLPIIPRQQQVRRLFSPSAHQVHSGSPFETVIRRGRRTFPFPPLSPVPAKRTDRFFPTSTLAVAPLFPSFYRPPRRPTFLFPPFP